ncbi:MAG: type transport system permease protein [Acidobacteriota bacterium]|nr:type transport system permease protein [Acidobacteriota bacterium]
MKFREIFRFELAYQVRRVSTWAFFAALLVISFLMTRDGTLAEALHDEFFINSPFAVAKTTVVGSLVWLLVAAAIGGEAAARDVATGMHPLTYTVPATKAEYLGGRFLAAFVLNALLLLAVQLGILLAVYWPGVDAALIGPFRPAASLTAYAFLALPNAFFATAIQFSLAARSGRPMTGYLGSVLLFFMSYVVSLFLLFQGRQDLANLLDPIGVHFILSDLSHLWTTIEKSTRLLELQGTVLTNRLLWLGVGLAALALTYLRFSFVHRTATTTRFLGFLGVPRRARPETEELRGTPRDSEELRGTGVPPRTFGFALHARQTLAIASTSFRTIAWSWAGLALLVVIPLLTIAVVIDQMETNGVPLVPTTVRVINELTAPLSAEMSRWVIIPLLIVYFAGELVWREREAGLGEITDTMPGSEWAPLLGKFLGLGFVLVAFTAVQTAAGMLAQVIPDHHDFELGLYLKALFGLQLPEYLLFALLVLVVHVLVDQKYLGHLAAIGAYVFIALSSMFGIEHNLLIYGAGPGWSYTEMRGFGPSIAPWLWFKLYWAAWALLLAVAARLLWVRGSERRLAVRLQLARRRFTRPTAWTAAAAVALILALGGFIFYNTNVLNEYRTAFETKERRAEYERRYGRYAEIPQPRLTGTSLRIEIHPQRRAVDIRGTYRLVNSTAAAIDAVHVATVRGVGALAFDRPAKLVVGDDDRGHRIYALAKPLQPGQSLRMNFEVHVQPRGFTNRGVDASVVANGTYFTNRGWLPAIGYQRDRQLMSAADRRAYRLAPRPLIASLYDAEERIDRGGGIAFEAVMSTDEDQVAVAPGALRRTWMEHGRRYFHYVTDGPIGNDYAFFSARYAVHEARWQNVAIRIFHHPAHTAHLERVVRSIRASLDYYTTQFGPYRYRHLTVVERPGNGTGMHADTSMISHAEGFSLWAPKDDPESLDLPFAIVAHEMAHQWTVPYALVEGAPVMSESLAWYYGMKAVEHARGREQLRLLLSFMRQPSPYPPIRRGEPLLRGLDPYMSYRRGPFALFTVSESIGAERVNRALRRLLEKHEKEGAPLATTLDLYRELQAVTPASFHPLLHDLFEVNTFWNFETDRATAKQTNAGTWQVTLRVKARKVVADVAGVETVMPIDEWVEIGVFGPAAKGHAELSAPLYLQKHRIRSGDQTITATVPNKPVLAGIDPYHLLDWVEGEDDDNIDAVKAER